MRPHSLDLRCSTRPACQRTVRCQWVRVAILLAVAVGEWSSRAACGDETPVSFRTDVMAALSKAGCNMGVCHGNKNGKGGFKLSLRGGDPDWDFAVLTRDQSGRRANRLEPDRSLVLLKPSLQVPHEGGRRFGRESPEYAILQNWIAAGMPRDSTNAPTLQNLIVSPREIILTEPTDRVQLQVTAEFSDGRWRDVTALAVYESSNQIADIGHDGLAVRRGWGETTIVVRFLDRQVPMRLAFIPARPDFTWAGPEPANFIDEFVFARLRDLRINPAPLCSDTVFLRRAYLDLVGMFPTAAEAREFFQDSRADKRARLVDDLLERQEFADFWALKWADLLRNEEKTLDRKGVENFYGWIRRGISDGKPLDQFARELVAARGSTYSVPAANYYRAMREPLTRAESTAQVFLGIRLQCAKCHNHPFDRWTQDDYYSWANLFARVDYKILENRRRDMNDGHEFDGEQIVFISRVGEVADPRSGKPQPPRFLGDAALPSGFDADRLLALGNWLTRPDNMLFAQVQANRIWFHLLGQGIVEPIDDFRATNPPVLPELLDRLARELVDRRYDLRAIIRMIMQSQTYQFSSVRNATNGDDETHFSRGKVMPLSAEQQADSLSRLFDVPLAFGGYPVGMRAGELPGVGADRGRDAAPTDAEIFLKLNGKPPRLQACECERTNEVSLSQALRSWNGGFLMDLVTRPHNRLGRLLDSKLSDSEIVTELYWTALSRPPAADELRTAVEYLSRPESRRFLLEDIAWALANSKEFLRRL